MNPVVLQVTRPYATEEEYLEAEAWTIDPRGMLLLEQGPLPEDTQLVFDVVLETGARMIRAEGRVGGHVPGDGDRRPALRVRFRRFGSQTKAFIDRALLARDEQLSRSAARPSRLPLRSGHPLRQTQAVTENPKTFGFEVPKTPALPDLETRPSPELSGIRRRVVSIVPAPSNREDLLQRLRSRRPNADGPSESVSLGSSKDRAG